MVELIGPDELLVTSQRLNGFGAGATMTLARDRVRVVTTEDFERRLKQNKPTGYHTIGFNAGAPRDGLLVYVGRSGIRYLTDQTGAGVVFVFADDASIAHLIGD